MYKPITTLIDKVMEETPTIKTYALVPEQPIAFATGQFMELTVPGYGEAPFTPSSSPAVSDRLEMTIMKVGVVTQKLHCLPAGATVGLRGPFGLGYPLADFAGRDIFILGGGVGLAPLRSLIYALLHERERFGKIILRYGARTPADMVYRDQLKEWQKMFDVDITVDRSDKSWKGNVGVVTTIVKDLDLNPAESIGVVCGPPIMMKFGTFKLLEVGFKPESLYLSMEKNMSCGLGKCRHCALGPFLVCKDGPVFTYDRIRNLSNIWE